MSSVLTGVGVLEAGRRTVLVVGGVNEVLFVVHYEDGRCRGKTDVDETLVGCACGAPWKTALVVRFSSHLMAAWYHASESLSLGRPTPRRAIWSWISRCNLQQNLTTIANPLEYPAKSINSWKLSR